MKTVSENQLVTDTTIDNFFLTLRQRLIKDLRYKDFFQYEIKVRKMPKGDTEIICSFAESRRYVIRKEEVERSGLQT